MSGEEKSSSLNILLGVTGSVATIKTCETIKLMQSIPTYTYVNIKLIVTQNSRHFLDVEEISNDLNVEVIDDFMEWKWEKRGDPVLHIEVTKWADVFVIAPLDCLTLSKIVHGHCDNLLSCVALAWPMKEKPMVVCPSMNPKMWENPATQENVAKLRAFGIEIVGPIAKKVMCGDFGLGAMEEPKEVVEKLMRILKRKPLEYMIPCAFLSLGILVTILGVVLPRHYRN